MSMNLSLILNYAFPDQPHDKIKANLVLVNSGPKDAFDKVLMGLTDVIKNTGLTGVAVRVYRNESDLKQGDVVITHSSEARYMGCTAVTYDDDGLMECIQTPVTAISFKMGVRDSIPEERAIERNDSEEKKLSPILGTVRIGGNDVDINDYITQHGAVTPVGVVVVSVTGRDDTGITSGMMAVYNAATDVANKLNCICSIERSYREDIGRQLLLRITPQLRDMEYKPSGQRMLYKLFKAKRPATKTIEPR